MTLMLCPECQSRVSARAAACPQCGYPFTGDVRLPVRATEAGATRPGSYVTTRFALTASVVLLVTGAFAMAGVEEEGFGILAGFITWGSMIPIWWKNRRAARTRAESGLIDHQMQQQLQEMEERFHRELSEIESNTRRVTDLEERLEFTERLLTKYRDNQIGG